MPRIQDAIEAATDRDSDDALSKILVAHAREIEKLFSLHGRRTNIEFVTNQLLKDREK
jgi:hypothetical protein